jgi:hypothetical protein
MDRPQTKLNKEQGGNSAPLKRAPYIFTFANVILPVFTGGGIYSLWRSKSLLVFSWYRWVGLYGPMLSLRAYLAGVKHLIPGPILYSLPDGLWVYSFTALMGYIWYQQPQRYARLFWTLLPVSMAVGAEIGQRLRLVPGTFDWADMSSYLVAWALATVSVQIFIGGKMRQLKVRSLHV